MIKKALAVAAGSLLTAGTLGAAELYGNLRGIPPNTQMSVKCGQTSFKPSIDKIGNYRVAGIPPNSTCTIELVSSGAKSTKVWVPVKSGQVAFNASIRIAGSKILVLKE